MENNAPWRLKENWVDGPWQNEPDFKYFIYKDCICVVKRNYYSGALLGYVLVKKNSKFDKHYDDLNFNVHGGLTYSGDIYFKEELQDQNLNLDDYNCIGFDCAHSGDIMPAYDAMNREIEKINELKKLAEINSKIKELRLSLSFAATYKTVEFVENELRNLVDQMIEDE